MRYIMLCVLLAGCSNAPQELTELEDAGSALLANYYDNSGEAVDMLRDWGLYGHRGWIDELALGSIDDATMVVETEDGERSVVDSSVAKTILGDYRTKTDELDLAVGRFDEKWEEARSAYLEAMEVRRQIREWLTRTGVQPEQIDAVTRALSDRMRK